MQTLEYGGLTSKKAKKDIKFCLQKPGRKIFTGDYQFFDDRFPLYLNTNDSIKSVVPDITFNDSKILAVASSGDYLLESVFNGATEVTTFDINKFQYYVSCLKVWAIQTLSYEDYVDFFHNPSSFRFISPELIDSVVQNFKGEPAAIFWNIFKEARHKEIQASKGKKFQCSAERKQTSLEDWQSNVALMNNVINSDVEAFRQYKVCKLFGPLISPRKFKALQLFGYLSAGPKFCEFSSDEKNYHLTRENLKDAEITFIHSDLLNLQDHLSSEEFDGIFLSNIPAYFSPQTTELAMKTLLPLIRTDGSISYYYQNMHTKWFEDYLENGMLPDDKCFQTLDKKTGRYSDSLIAYGNLMGNGLNVRLQEVPTAYNLGDDTKPGTDVKCLVKKIID